MPALVRTVAVFVFSALALVGLGAAPALADQGNVTWTVRTASNSYGADRSNFSYAVNPGGRVADTMVVANRGKTPLNLAVYAADGLTTEAGQLDLVTRDAKSVAVGAWVRPAAGTVTIPAGRSADIPFALTVPDNATPGQYVGGIVTSLTQPSQTQGINVERRLGIRINLRVSGPLKPGLAIEDLHLGYAGSVSPFARGDATVTYRIHNTGNTVLSARQAVSVSGPFGWLRTGAGDIPQPPELLPGESRTVTVPVHGVSPGFRLTATATLTPLLTDAAGTTTSLGAVRASTHRWAVPWALLLLVVVLVAAVVTAIPLARRARARRKLRQDARVQEAVEQALRDQKDETRTTPGA